MVLPVYQFDVMGRRIRACLATGVAIIMSTRPRDVFICVYTAHAAFIRGNNEHVHVVASFF